MLTPKALPSTHQIRLLTPRSSRPNPTRNLRPKHLHFRRAPQHPPNPSTLFLSRSRRPPDPLTNLLLRHLRNLQIHALSPAPQRRANAQAAPAEFLNACKKSEGT